MEVADQATEWFDLARGEPAERNLKKRPSNGAATPALSVTGSNTNLGNRKDCDSKVGIKGWPSIAAFRSWKLALKKSLASTSRRAKIAYAWITELEKATCIVDLEDSGDFE